MSSDQEQEDGADERILFQQESGANNPLEANGHPNVDASQDRLVPSSDEQSSLNSSSADQSNSSSLDPSLFPPSSRSMYQTDRSPYQNRRQSDRPQERVSSPIDDTYYIFTQVNVAAISFPMFNELRSNGKLLDVDIVVDGTCIKAHKVVLAATIPYFQAMFTHDVIEATSSVINITAESSAGISSSARSQPAGSSSSPGSHSAAGPSPADAVRTTVQSAADPGDGGQATGEENGPVGDAVCQSVAPPGGLEPDDESDPNQHFHSEHAWSPHRMDGEAFKSLIDFAYTGSIKITVSNVQSILVAASYLGLQSVCDACSDYLQERLQSNNVLGIKSFAESLSCPNLVTAASKYIEQHFEQVSKSDEFMQLNDKDVADIISKDELNVRGEEVVFEAVLNWIKFGNRGKISSFQSSNHNQSKSFENRGTSSSLGNEREEYLPNLLTLVRLPLLTPQFLADHVATESLIRMNHGCRDLLDEAKDYHLMPERRLLLQSFRTRPRNNADNIGVIYAVGGLTKTGDSLSTVETYDVKEDRWFPAEAMSMLRSRVGVAVMGSKLYAIGGYNGTERLSTVEVFDPLIKQWSRVSSMNCKRSAVGAATLGNRLYVCGGYDGVSSLNTVECYNSDRNEWIMIQCMSKHRSAAGVVSFQGALIALGGHDGLSIFDSVEKFDPIKQDWSPLPSMLTRRCRLGVAALGGKLYVCGGYDGSTFLQTAEVYDPENKSWSFIAPMNVMRSRVALVANCGKLFAIGGYDGVSNLSTVEVYDPAIDKWTFVCPMGAHEGGVGVGVIPNF